MAAAQPEVTSFRCDWIPLPFRILSGWRKGGKAAHCVLAQNPENVELARFYCHTQKTISKRLVLRQDPSVKRTICKRCYSLLLPGITATIRQRRHYGQRRTVVRCLSCGLTKRFLNNPNYKLWSEQPEALLENQPKPEQNTIVQQNQQKEKKKAKPDTK